MRKYFLLLVFFPLFMSCSSDDGDEFDFMATEIIPIPQRNTSNFGRYQVLDAVLNRHQDGVSVKWSYDDDSNAGEGDTLRWWPQYSKTYTLKATLSHCGSVKVLTKQVDVIDCHFGFAFHGQTPVDVMKNETMWAAYTWHDMPFVDTKPFVNDGPNGRRYGILWRYFHSDDNLYYNYIFYDDMLDIGYHERK